MIKPRCELSLIVTVRSGPGISAPESAIMKDETKIVRRVVNTVIIKFYFFFIAAAICLALLKSAVLVIAFLAGL
jgi:hypothetical protein